MARHVMDGAGFYNRHSAQQEAAASAAVAMFQRAARAADLAPHEPLLIADLGSSQGKNSMHPVAVAIDALWTRAGAEPPILVVHTDLPENDFSALFDTIANDPDSYRRPGVFSYASGRSFYDQLFPDETLTLAWSATAAVWLSTTPCELPDHLFSFAATGPRRERWKQAAARDWETFLGHRARELHEGGQLVVTLPVAGNDYLEWMHVVESAAREALLREVVTADEYRSMVIPTYLSEPADLRSAVAQLGDLVLEEFEIGVAPDPAYSSFRDHHSAERYASEAVDLFRAWAEPALMSSLDPERDPSARDATAAEFFACVREALAARPTACDWSIGLLRIRR